MQCAAWRRWPALFQQESAPPPMADSGLGRGDARRLTVGAIRRRTPIPFRGYAPDAR